MTKQERRGRKDGTERVRELVALLGSLSKVGDSISLDAISSRLGISLDDARIMMDIMCMASGEESGGLLISSNDDETEYTLQYLGTRGRPLRLTTTETIAVVHALDLAGVSDDDPLRARLSEALTSPDVLAQEVRRSLGDHDDDPMLSMCARAQTSQRELVFSYRGLKDELPRRRRVLVRRTRLSNDQWHMDAYDLDLSQERTFRIDRMGDASVGDFSDLPEELPRETTELEVRFLDRKYLTMFDWQNLRIIRESSGVIHGVLPYYNNSSTWLLRRICACEGTFVVEDERIMQQAKEYAASLLDT